MSMVLNRKEELVLGHNGGKDITKDPLKKTKHDFATQQINQNQWGKSKEITF